MRNREVLKRIDGHLDRADRHFERADERWASIDDEIRLTREEIRLSREGSERSRQQHERHAEMFADLRVFTRDMMRRMERVTERQVAALRDLHEESVAHRQALLGMVDRLDPGDSPSAG